MSRKLLLTAVLTGLMVITASAQVETLWQRMAAQDMHPNWFGTGTERGLAYGVVDGNARLFVASRSTTPQVIRIVDAETGSDVGTLSSEGVSGGYLGIFLLNDVGVSDDGIIFASNMELDASVNSFKIYRWTSETADPTVAISYLAPEAWRLGDRITVTGSAEDNTLTIYAAVANGNRFVRFTTTDNGDSFDSQVVTLEGIEVTSIFPNVTPMLDATGDFFFNAGFGTAGVRPRFHRADGSFVRTIDNIPVGTNTIRYFEANDRAYLGVFDGQVDTRMTFSVYDITGGGSQARHVLTTPSFGREPNAFGAGDFEVVVAEDGSVTLYGLVMNNGIAAFSLDLARPFQGAYYVGAEGTAPGGGNPDFATLREAFVAVNATVPTGALHLLITSDLDERGTDVHLVQTGLTAATPVVIRPASGVTATVTLGAISAAAGVDAQNSGLSIDNTSYVTIDGNNGDEEGTRDLTFMLMDGTGTRVISIVRGAEHITVRNAVVLRETYNAASEGIRVRRANDAQTGLAPDVIVIENNQIGSVETPVKDGVGLFGTDGLPVLDTWVRNNDIYAGHRGITTFWNSGIQHYVDNRITITGHQTNPAWFAGVYLAAVENTVLTGNEIVLGGVNFTTDNRYIAGVVLNVNLGQQHLFANNTIATAPDFVNRGTATAVGVYGIGNHRASVANEPYLIYHNTIRIDDTGLTGVHAGIGHPEDSGLAFTTTTKVFDIKNNIIVNERDAANSFAIHWRVASEGGFQSDYNNLYVESSQGATILWRAERLRDLTDWQFSQSYDAHSVSVPVEFVSATDLRLSGASVGDTRLAGIPLAAITTDIDGRVRRDRPYMGAFEGDTPVNVNPDLVAETPETFTLEQNYPNPFNPTTNIRFTLREAGHVSVRVYNVAGQMIQELVNEYRGQGPHEVTFDAANLASGVYVYRMELSGQSQTRRMVLVK
jgi:hypothetical protein